MGRAVSAPRVRMAESISPARRTAPAGWGAAACAAASSNFVTIPGEGMVTQKLAASFMGAASPLLCIGRAATTEPTKAHHFDKNAPTARRRLSRGVTDRHPD